MPVHVLDGDAGMPSVRQIDRSMIEETVKRMDLAYQRDASGDVVVGFGHSDEWGCALTVVMQLEGQTSIYTVRVQSDRRFAPEHWEYCIHLCNSWNREHRWPKAFLHTPNGGSEGLMYLEEILDLRTGVHQELLEDFTATVLWTADQFWKWANRQLSGAIEQR